ncbi:MAG: adenosine deaminase [Opitutales bacterium]
MNRRQFLATASTTAAVSLAAPARSLGQTPASPLYEPSDHRQLLSQIIHGLPKAELHIHFEGLLEAADIIRLNRKNKVGLPYASVEDVLQRFYTIRDLPTFIEVYEGFASVLVEEADYYDLAWRFFVRSQQQGVRRIEMFIGPQLHQGRSLSQNEVVGILDQAARDAEAELGLSVAYILGFHRNRPSAEAMDLLKDSDAVRDKLIGIGLDHPEVEGFPQKFAEVYQRAREMGFRLTAHCDVNQPESYLHIRDCIEVLGVERIDHGVNTVDRPELVALAKERGIGFTPCPTIRFSPEGLGRTYLKIVTAKLRKMRELGLRAMINTDDPGLMASAYLNDVYHFTADDLGWGVDDLTALAKASFEVSWMSDAAKEKQYQAIDTYVAAMLKPQTTFRPEPLAPAYRRDA